MDFGSSDLDSLTEGDILISASQSDESGNMFATEFTVFKSGSGVSDRVSIDEISAVTVDNEESYSLEGDCTPQDLSFTLSVGGVGPVAGNPLTCSATERWEASFDLQGVSDTETLAVELSYSSVPTLSYNTIKDTVAPSLSLNA